MQQSEVTSATSKAICPQGNSVNHQQVRQSSWRYPQAKTENCFYTIQFHQNHQVIKLCFSKGCQFIFISSSRRFVSACHSQRHCCITSWFPKLRSRLRARTRVLIAHQQSMTLIGIYVAIGLATRTLRHVLWFQSKSCLMCARINSEFITITIYHATVTGICLWGFYCMEASLVSSEVGWKNDRCVP